MKKALSLWQPWASLLVMGVKKIETRGIATRYRGTLYIHATKKTPLSVLNSIFGDSVFCAIFKKYFPEDSDNIPHSAIIGSVDIVDCVPVEQIKDKLTSDELALGDYSFGRFAWITANPVMFDEPIPAKGMQGLWNWDGECL